MEAPALLTHIDDALIDHILRLKPQVRRLNLSRNEISDVGPVLHRVHTLTHLDLTHNRLRDINSSFAALTQLQKLGLAHNEITSIAGLAACVSLEALDLRYNRISSVDALTHLHTLPRLHTLLLAGNPIADRPDVYPHAVFAALPQLVQLDEHLAPASQPGTPRAGAARLQPRSQTSRDHTPASGISMGSAETSGRSMVNMQGSMLAPAMALWRDNTGRPIYSPPESGLSGGSYSDLVHPGSTVASQPAATFVGHVVDFARASTTSSPQAPPGSHTWQAEGAQAGLHSQAGLPYSALPPAHSPSQHSGSGASRQNEAVGGFAAASAIPSSLAVEIATRVVDALGALALERSTAGSPSKPAHAAQQSPDRESTAKRGESASSLSRESPLKLDLPVRTTEASSAPDAVPRPDVNAPPATPRRPVSGREDPAQVESAAASSAMMSPVHTPSIHTPPSVQQSHSAPGSLHAGCGRETASATAAADDRALIAQLDAAMQQLRDYEAALGEARARLPPTIEVESDAKEASTRPPSVPERAEAYTLALRTWRLKVMQLLVELEEARAAQQAHSAAHSSAPGAHSDLAEQLAETQRHALHTISSLQRQLADAATGAATERSVLEAELHAVRRAHAATLETLQRLQVDMDAMSHQQAAASREDHQAHINVVQSLRHQLAVAVDATSRVEQQLLAHQHALSHLSSGITHDAASMTTDMMHRMDALSQLVAAALQRMGGRVAMAAARARTKVSLRSADTALLAAAHHAVARERDLWAEALASQARRHAELPPSPAHGEADTAGAINPWDESMHARLREQHEREIRAHAERLAAATASVDYALDSLQRQVPATGWGSTDDGGVTPANIAALTATVAVMHADDVRAELVDAHTDRVRLQRRLEECSQQLRLMETDALQASRAEAARLQERVDAAERAARAAERRSAQFEAELGRARESHDREQQQSNSARTRQVQTAKDAAARAKAHAATLESQLESLRAEHTHARAEIVRLERELVHVMENAAESHRRTLDERSAKEIALQEELVAVKRERNALLGVLQQSSQLPDLLHRTRPAARSTTAGPSSARPAPVRLSEGAELPAGATDTM